MQRRNLSQWRNVYRTSRQTSLLQVSSDRQTSDKKTLWARVQRRIRNNNKISVCTKPLQDLIQFLNVWQFCRLCVFPVSFIKPWLTIEQSCLFFIIFIASTEDNIINFLLFFFLAVLRITKAPDVKYSPQPSPQWTLNLPLTNRGSVNHLLSRFARVLVTIPQCFQTCWIMPRKKKLL